MHTIAGGRATAPPVDDRPQLARSVLVRPARRAPSLRGDIQGMRALAVLLVLFAHAGIRGFAGGYRARPQAGPVIIRRRLNGSRGRAGAT